MSVNENCGEINERGWLNSWESQGFDDKNERINSISKKGERQRNDFTNNSRSVKIVTKYDNLILSDDDDSKTCSDSHGFDNENERIHSSSQNGGR